LWVSQNKRGKRQRENGYNIAVIHRGGGKGKSYPRYCWLTTQQSYGVITAILYIHFNNLHHLPTAKYVLNNNNYSYIIILLLKGLGINQENIAILLFKH